MSKQLWGVYWEVNVISKIEADAETLRRENEQLKKFVKRIYIVGIRILFSIKQLIRVGALFGCYFWKGMEATIVLAGVIALIILAQSGINKLKMIIRPELSHEFNEWGFII